MEQKIYQTYLDILKEELVPAMGCTEPIAVAYAAAKARQVLGVMPERIAVSASPNIIKNVKSVIVPNTGSLRGIEAAAVAGAVVGDADEELQVLSHVTQEQITEIAEALHRIPCEVSPSDNGYVFYLRASVEGGGHAANVEITGTHTNITRIEKDGKVLFASEYTESGTQTQTDRSLLNVRDIIEFADTVNIEDIAPVLDRQITYNTAIADEGLRGNWGANIGSILLKSYGSNVHNRAKAYAAAGSDARMSGCELPVVINSGSGNQGLTASLPVIVYAKELDVGRDMLYRALAVSNLVTIHLKTGIGALSAYCGATSAGCGAGAGITYLYGGKYHEISHTIVNAIAINSGMICDGAKPSCAAKIASAVEAGLLGFQMQSHDSQFYGGEGIVVKGVENTIQNVNSLAHDGMKETDRVIIHMMTEDSSVQKQEK
jgi:L-cysteine desulfidase